MGTVRAVARVRIPAESNDEVAVAPKLAVFAVVRPAYTLVPVALVVVSPPLNARFVVVALPGNRYAKVEVR